MASSPSVAAAFATIRSGLDRAAGSALFAYGSILLIQSKVLWGIWKYRDLSFGDTSDYFVGASRWAESFDLNSIHYPAYTFAWGSLQWLVSDPYAVTIVHRVVIALVASLLVLAVLRRLLAPGIALALAVWWTILPINYDTVYEVHLFALLPGLVAVLIALSWTGLRMRSAVFAALLLTTVLMRAETVFALAIWTIAWIAYEVREARRGRPTPPGRLTRAFGLPALGAIVLATAVVLSDSQPGGLLDRFSAKASLNTCQNYAFGYEQRHGYGPSPFAGCGALALRDFDDESPSLIGAIEANPGAMGEHFLWNARLVPHGLELMLFDRISAGPDHNPDYLVEVETGSSGSLIGLICLAALMVVGLALLWRDRRQWWEDWVRGRAWGWLALGSLAITAAIVMIWQRPRPSYLFALTVLILATAGMCAMAYADRWPWLRRLRPVLPILVVSILIAVPPHYGPDYQTAQIGRPGRPMKLMLDRLYPFRSELRTGGAALLATYASPVCPYLGGEKPCKAVSWKAIVHRPRGIPLRSSLDARGVDFVYADEADLQDSSLREAVGAPAFRDWQLLAPAGEGWALLRRFPAESGSH
jgi:hypothetical protein